jgi:glycosyltransferase involved in cell wall biosynthesis
LPQPLEPPRQIGAAERHGPILTPVCGGSGSGVLFWYGAPHVAVAENSRRYRIANRLQVLPAARSVVSRTIPEDMLAGVHTVVSLRPFVDSVALRQIARLRGVGIRLVADYDDLLFDCPPSDFPGADYLLRRLRIARRLETYRSSVHHFDAFTTSTWPIAHALRAIRPDAAISVVPNQPSPAWVARGWARYGACAWKPGDARIVRYLPGSPSHDRDFAMIEEALIAFLHLHTDVELEVVGYLKFHQRSFPPGRVRHLPKVDYELFPKVLLSTWINLVPLAPTVYSQARSALKLLEAAAFGVPSIATPSTDHARTAELPSPIHFAHTPAEWLEALDAAHRATPTDLATLRHVRVASEVSATWSTAESIGALVGPSAGGALG